MKPSEIIGAIRATADAHAALYIWGPPGVGKTACVTEAALTAGLRCVTLRANLLEPVDVLGLPTPDGDRVKWLKPDFLPDDDGQPGLLFIDEFAQAPMATQCALMRLVDNLPNAWHVVAASNRSDDRAGAGQVATHVLSRFTHVDFDVSREDWQRWAATNGIRPEVRGFIDFRPGLLFNFDAAKRQKDRAGCDPRSWHRVSRIVETIDDCDSDLQFPLIAGTVGEGAASEFTAFLRNYAKLPDIDALLAAPDTTTVPTEPDLLFAICAALADRAKTLATPKLEALVRYLARLPVEFGALLMTDCLSVAPSCLMVPSAGAWITKHQSIFANSRK